jgi:hypothetical protein
VVGGSPVRLHVPEGSLASDPWRQTSRPSNPFSDPAGGLRHRRDGTEGVGSLWQAIAVCRTRERRCRGWANTYSLGVCRKMSHYFASKKDPKPVGPVVEARDGCPKMSQNVPPEKDPNRSRPVTLPNVPADPDEVGLAGVRADGFDLPSRQAIELP